MNRQYPASDHISALEWLALLSLVFGGALLVGLVVFGAIWAIGHALEALRG